MTSPIDQLGNEAQAAINDAMAAQKAFDELAAATSQTEYVAALEGVARAAEGVDPLRARVSQASLDRLRDATQALHALGASIVDPESPR